MIKKILFITLGTITLALGSIGVFIPGIPVTPLLLLSAYLYSKSSERLYKKLMDSTFLGKYIKNYTAKGGMTIKTKIYAISFMAIMITISTTLLIESEVMKIVVLSLGAIGFIVMGFVVKTVK